MTTLQSFQTEIDQINKREREMSKHLTTLEKEKEIKDGKKSTRDVKSVTVNKPQVNTVDATATASNHNDGTTSPVLERIAERDDDRAATAQEEESQIVVCYYLGHIPIAYLTRFPVIVTF
jgi:hypothetical protein